MCVYHTRTAFTAGTVPEWFGIPLPLWLQPFFFTYGLLMAAPAAYVWTHWLPLDHPEGHSEGPNRATYSTV